MIDRFTGVAALRGVGVQAVVTEYLITNCKQIFDADEAFSNKDNHMGSASNDSATDSDGVEQRNCSVDMMNPSERPKSLNVGGAKLISLEEAQVRQSRNEMLVDPHKAVPINNSLLTQHSSYIEVGGGPASLPDKYHTVLPVPRSWQKRKTTSWKSLFTRNSRQSNSNSDIKSRHSANGTKLPIDSKLIGHPKLLEEKAKLIALRGKSVNGINEESRGHRPDLKLNKSMHLIFSFLLMKFYNKILFFMQVWMNTVIIRVDQTNHWMLLYVPIQLIHYVQLVIVDRYPMIHTLIYYNHHCVVQIVRHANYLNWA